MPAKDLWASSQGKNLRKACYQRDAHSNQPCWICHLPIDYTLGMYKPGKSTNCYEPDHVKPRAKYPELTLDPTNIRASHAHCNRSRGKKAGKNELGTPTRQWF
ncbi:HNH endonuclease [Alloscardovia omnicolens]|uniref:HNH endonuclease n=1 Tax=Actinomycetes TaxID=1760 RepID=UPI0009B720F2